nr:uncharacterized protein LOC117277812 isoform X1 [Nicotiana tomentosiformis]
MRSIYGILHSSHLDFPPSCLSLFFLSLSTCENIFNPRLFHKSNSGQNIQDNIIEEVTCTQLLQSTGIKDSCSTKVPPKDISVCLLVKNKQRKDRKIDYGFPVVLDREYEVCTSC